MNEVFLPSSPPNPSICNSKEYDIFATTIAFITLLANTKWTSLEYPAETPTHIGRNCTNMSRMWHVFNWTFRRNRQQQHQYYYKRSPLLMRATTV